MPAARRDSGTSSSVDRRGAAEGRGRRRSRPAAHRSSMRDLRRGSASRAAARRPAARSSRRRRATARHGRAARRGRSRGTSWLDLLRSSALRGAGRSPAARGRSGVEEVLAPAVAELRGEAVLTHCRSRQALEDREDVAGERDPVRRSAAARLTRRRRRSRSYIVRTPTSARARSSAARRPPRPGRPAPPGRRSCTCARHRAVGDVVVPAVVVGERASPERAVHWRPRLPRPPRNSSRPASSVRSSPR